MDWSCIAMLRSTVAAGLSCLYDDTAPPPPPVVDDVSLAFLSGGGGGGGVGEGGGVTALVDQKRSFLECIVGLVGRGDRGATWIQPATPTLPPGLLQ